MNKKIRVIARGSRLSRLQVEEVFRNFPDLDYEIKYLESYGDKNQQISLLNGEAPADIFTRELDEAILSGEADIAVHSAKDLPYPLPEDIEVIALFPAFDTTDSLVSRDHKTLAELPAGSIIGTSSPLRKKGLNKLRPDLVVKGIRGCIEERVQQVKDGKYDAAIVATCALKRLGMENEIAEILPFATHPLQGYLAVTGRKVKSEERRTKNQAAEQENSSLFALHSSLQNLLPRQGKVQLVGFGPGNPDLLTIKAARAIDQADIIFYDDLIDSSFLADKKAEKVYVGKRAGYHHKEQGDINRLLLDAARKGKNVVRLKGGDPMVFAHGSEEIEYLESNLVEVEVIPGITTASALAASQKISLTHRDFSSSVALVSGHTPQPVTPDAETLVYYMGARQLQAIATRLIDMEGWAFNTPVLLTYNVSRSDEQTFETTLWSLRNDDGIEDKPTGKHLHIAELPTPLIALIGNVAGLKHHQASDIKPTLYTGSLPPVEKRHPDYTYTPLIEIHLLPQDDIQGKYDYWLFTSQYAVASLAQALKHRDDSKVVSIGPTTTEALNRMGVEEGIQVEPDNRYGVIDWFKKNRQASKHSRILYPHSDLSPRDIAEALSDQGYEVEDLIAYRNTMPSNPRRVNLSHFKRIVFTSPSTIDNFISLYGQLPEGVEFITRGPITQAHLNQILTDINYEKIQRL